MTTDKPDNKGIINRRIAERRRALGMSMEALAKECGYSSWQTVQQWEDGRTAPRRAAVTKAAHALQTTVAWLEGLTDNPDPDAAHSGPTQPAAAALTLTTEEQELVSFFRSASIEVQALLLRMAREPRTGKNKINIKATQDNALPPHEVKRTGGHGVHHRNRNKT